MNTTTTLHCTALKLATNLDAIQLAAITELEAAREHLAMLMTKALDAGDGELYQDLQDQLGRTYR